MSADIVKWSGLKRITRHGMFAHRGTADHEASKKVLHEEAHFAVPQIKALLSARLRTEMNWNVSFPASFLHAMTVHTVNDDQRAVKSFPIDHWSHLRRCTMIIALSLQKVSKGEPLFASDDSWLQVGTKSSSQMICAHAGVPSIIANSWVVFGYFERSLAG
jgi:hypothetical protein